MAKKTKTEDLVAPVIDRAVQIGAPQSIEDLDKIKIPGLALRWVNPAVRNSGGWDHWRPVEVESEIGNTVMKAVKDMGDHFGGLNLDTSYIYRSSNCMLAYAKQTDVDAYKAGVRARHQEVMKVITHDDAVTTQSMMVHRPT